MMDSLKDISRKDMIDPLKRSLSCDLVVDAERQLQVNVWSLTASTYYQIVYMWLVVGVD
jgi:hypothetical protein